MDTKLVCLLLALITLAGCQNPMGLSKTQWEALPPEQQAEYRRQQTVIDEQHRKERAEAAERQKTIDAELAARQQTEAAEQVRREQMRLESLYAHARNGDIVTVTIEGGLIDFGKHAAYEPLRFDIVRGERKHIEITKQGNSHIKQLVRVRLCEEGNRFLLF